MNSIGLFSQELLILLYQVIMNEFFVILIKILPRYNINTCIECYFCQYGVAWPTCLSNQLWVDIPRINISSCSAQM